MARTLLLVLAVVLTLCASHARAGNCSQQKTCYSCVRTSRWFNPCRWCPQTSTCHSPGAVFGNECSMAENVIDPAACARTVKPGPTMKPCPPRYDASWSDTTLPAGWKPYPGESKFFHCGFRGFIEDGNARGMINECFYDDDGALVTESHRWGGCRGTPDEHDASNAPVAHTIFDSGGICDFANWLRWKPACRVAWTAFTTSLRYHHQHGTLVPQWATNMSAHGRKFMQWATNIFGRDGEHHNDHDHDHDDVV